MARDWAERMLEVLDDIQAHLDDEDLDAARLADRAGFSKHHFHRVFRGMTGESVMGLVRRLRMERAAQRLRFGQTSVTDVAFASGYGSHEAFTRAFRERFGVAPRDFRDQAWADAAERVEARTEVRDAIETIGLRHTGSYATCAETWGRLLGGLAQRGRFMDVQASFGLVYDDPDITAADNLRYDACVRIEGPTDALRAEWPELRARTIPGGRYAVARHYGPYDTMNATYVGLLGGWLPHRGVELYDEPVVEIYLNDPQSVPASELVSEICVRIT